MEIIEKGPVKVTGRIKAFKANKHGDIDALELENNGSSIKVNFPPHTAKAVKSLVDESDEIEVVYNEEPPKHDPKGHKKSKNKLEYISQINADRKVVIKDIKPPKDGFDHAIETFSFTHFEIIKGKKEEVTGIREGDKLVHIHKEDEEMAKNIKNGANPEFNAIKRIDDGFINQANANVYHFKSVLIDGKEHVSKHNG